MNTVLPASEYNFLNCPQTGSHTVPPKHSVVCLSKYTARVHNDGSEDSAFKSSQRRRSKLFCTEEREVRDHKSKEDQSYGDWKLVVERIGARGAV